MMMMSRTQPLGEGRRGGGGGGARVRARVRACVCAWGGGGRGRGGKGSERGGPPSGTPRRGPRRCFLPRPPGLAAREEAAGGGGGASGPAPGAGIDDSAGGHGHLRGGGGAPMSWMREGGRGRSGARRDWPGIARARLADRHFTSCGGGGGGRRDGFLQAPQAAARARACAVVCASVCASRRASVRVRVRGGTCPRWVTSLPRRNSGLRAFQRSVRPEM
ncbi:putative glycine-rich cell wall structural protein 1 [Vulpes lagopus]|uniref:putative glycine-rich cell wall structural protein 1 n=1 Tax=Vulpes lagopus TaxID=494514 RepID=UPI001BCA45E2|nr:putative glycine-rich cell wall structural protein 1 [Vulpes lagopus]